MGKSTHTQHNINMSAPSLMVVAVLLLTPSLEAQATQTTLAPSYSTASIANAATNIAAGFAPNSIISIYGSNLSNGTAGVTSTTGILPVSLAGVTVYISGKPGALFYISPNQVNVLIPYNLSAGPSSVTLVREGTAGPTIPIVLTATAPGLFELAATTILATHADGSLISTSSPAMPGEVIVIYAVGLGPTIPEQNDGQIPPRSAVIADFASMNVLLNGAPVVHSTIQYAGITPGCAGLYQINLLLPTPLPSNPEIRVQIGNQISPAAMNLVTP
jgi:uncharacterized protein (TIGR03437 family)